MQIEWKTEREKKTKTEIALYFLERAGMYTTLNVLFEFLNLKLKKESNISTTISKLNMHYSAL